MNGVKHVKGYFGGNRQMRILIGTLFALVVSDGLISRFLVTNGLAREGNPFLQVWVDKDMFLFIKIAAAFLVALILWDMYKHHPRLSLVSALCFVAGYTVIVFWSLAIFLITRAGVFA